MKYETDGDGVTTALVAEGMVRIQVREVQFESGSTFLWAVQGHTDGQIGQAGSLEAAKRAAELSLMDTVRAMQTALR